MIQNLKPGEKIKFPEPFYDIQLRELWFGFQLIKRYRTPARNQTAILAAFQESKWNRSLPNPIPITSYPIDRKRQLHDTINSLNRGHFVKGLIRFIGDGTGESIIWYPGSTHTLLTRDW